ncbi:hypothetical protein [Vibrio sp. CK2-1]|uniref:hypothetical protein n=1 Tax=Vibrio sp. CK2-1 TaxID=2912249 RepID=UPI001F364D60|nr:hypothetical protein [Vibrio sp. CK2-1]MCF7355367.1 hypothetical protein [Vibrio sp. CK2-1]
MKKLLLIGLGLVVLSGCSARFTDMTLASTKNVDLNSGQLVTGQRVKAQDMYPVFIIPLGTPNMKNAIDKAIESDKCAIALSDVVITQLNHAFIFGEFGLEVEGNLLLDKSRPGCENADTKKLEQSPLLIK